MSAFVLSALLLAAFTGAAAATRIGSFAPTSGPIGTLITVSGSGFTGFTTAWIGAAHDAALTVVSDTSLQIVVPADAVTGAQAVEILSATGNVTATQKFKVTAPLPAVTLTADPATITAGGSSTLAWASTNATSCTASGGWAGSSAISGVATVAPVATKTYSISCKGAGGTTKVSATITVDPAPVPTVTINANPPAITAGASSTLTWSSTGATTCTASGGWTGAQATSGSATLSPASTKTYSLSCKGPGGTTKVAATVTVTAAATPTVTITAKPATISPGASSTLTWSSTNATSCAGSGSWTGTEPLAGSLVVTPGTSATYILTCANSSNQATSIAAVTVVQPPQPTVTIGANPPSLNSGASSTLTWASTNATSCTASGAWSGPEATSGTLVVTPSATGAYALSCSGAGGNAAATTTVTVAPAGVPTVNLSANPTGIVAGGSSTLTWTSTNSTSCTASGGWSGTKATSGSALVTPTTTTTYSLTCSTAAATATVSVGAAAGAGTVSITGMPLISRNVPAYASSAQSAASAANDADYNTTWRSNGVPATLAYDLSAVPVAQRQTVLLIWYDDDTYDYDHVLGGGPGYNNPGSYTIEANAAAGGSNPPASGWVVLASVTGNSKNSLEHLLAFAGYNWIRANFSVSDGSSGNTDIDINMDVYDAAAITDGWFFGGDSITANCMDHLNGDSHVAPAFGAQVGVATGSVPLQINGGMAGWATADLVQYLPTWLPTYQGHFVTINLGTNDAAQGISPSVFYANLQTLVGDVEGAGKIAVVPTIPYSPEPTHLANIPGLNAQIANLYVNHATVVPGPDLFTYFEQNPSLISSDQVHPTDLGCVDYRALWGQSAIGQYAANGSTTPTVSISASPTTVSAAGQSTLSWSSTNATSCTASGSWTGSEVTSGNLIVAPTTTSSYTITCTGPGGAGYATTQVTVH